MSTQFFRYTIKWSNDSDRGVDRGIMVAESYTDAANKIEDCYGSQLCNVRLGMIEVNTLDGFGIEIDQLEEIVEDIGLEEGLNA